MPDQLAARIILRTDGYVKGLAEAEKASVDFLRTAAHIDKQLAELEAKFASLASEEGRTEGETEKLTREMEQQRRIIERLLDTAEKQARELDDVTESTERSRRAAERLNKEWDAVVGVLGRVRDRYLDVNQAIRAGEFVVESFASVEKAMVGVRKTTNLTAQEMAELQSSIENLSTAVGGVPRKLLDLIKIGELAGQVGVSGREDLLRYVEVFGMLDVATDVTVDNAVKQLTRLANVQGESAETIGRTATVLVQLGNTAAASEREILARANEVGRATANFKLGTTDVLGIAAALAELGIRAESGGSQVGLALTRMSEAVLLGGEELQTFADVAGVSAEEFARAWERDPVAAFDLLLSGLRELGPAATLALDELELGTLRGKKVLIPLAESVEILRKNLANARGEAEQQTALTREAAAAFDTLQSDIDRASNALVIMASDIGEGLSPALRRMMTDFSVFSSEFDAERFGREVGDALETIVDLLSSGGKAIGLLLNNLAAVKGAMAALLALRAVAFFEGLVSGAATATAKLKAMLASVNALQLGIGLLVGAAVAANSAISQWAASIDRDISRTVDSMNRFTAGVAKIKESAADLLDAAKAEEEVRRRLLRSGIAEGDPREAEIRLQVMAELHAKRVDLLSEQTAMLDQARKAEADHRAAMEQTIRTIADLTAEQERLNRAGSFGPARGVGKQIEFQTNRLRDYEREANQAHISVKTLEQSVSALGGAVADYAPPVRKAVTATNELIGVTGEITAAENELRAELAAVADEVADLAEKTMSTATSAGDDLRGSLDNVAAIIESELGPSLRDSERDLKEWSEALEQSEILLKKERSALKDAVEARIAAADAAMRAADSDAQRLRINRELAADLQELVGALHRNAQAEGELAAARARSQEVAASIRQGDAERRAIIEGEIEDLREEAAAIRAGGGAFEELMDQRREAAAWEEVYQRALEETGATVEEAARLADEYVAALRELKKAEKEAAEEGRKLDRVVAVIGEIASSLRDVEGISGDVAAAFQGISTGAQLYQQARAEGETRNKAIQAGIGGGMAGGMMALMQSTGYGGGGTSQFGGRMSGNLSKEGMQIGGMFGPVWAFVGFVIGGLIQTGADDATIAIEEAGEKAEAQIIRAEGGLQEISGKIAGVIGDFLNTLNEQLGGVLDIAGIGAAEIRIRNDRVIVEVNGVVKGFRDLNAALGYFAEQVLTTQDQVEGIGDNVRGVFQAVGQAQEIGNLESLTKALELAVEVDRFMSGVYSEAITRYRQMRSELAAQMDVAREYGLVLSDVIAFQNEQLRLAKEELVTARQSFFGARSNLLAIQDLVGSMEAFNVAMDEEQAARLRRQQALIASLGELGQAVTDLSAGTSDASASMVASIGAVRAAGSGGGRQPGPSIGPAGGFAEGGIQGTVGGRLEEVGKLRESVHDLERAREEIDAIAETIGGIPDQFSAEEIVQVWRVGASQAGQTLINMIRLVRGEQFAADQSKLFATIQYAAALAEQIKVTEQLLAATDVLDQTTRGFLQNLIAEGSQVLADIAAGREQVPMPGRAGGRGERRRRRDELLEYFDDVTDRADGASEAMMQFRDRLQEIAEAAAEADRLGIAADRIAEFVADAFALAQEDVLGEHRERQRQREETPLETELRQVEEMREEVLAQLRAMAEEQAAITGETFESIFGPMAEEANRIFDADRAEVMAGAAEEQAEAERDLAEAMEEETEARRQNRQAIMEAIDAFAAAGGNVSEFVRAVEDAEVERQRLIMAAYEEFGGGTGEFLAALDQIEQGFDGMLESIGREVLQSTQDFLQRHGASLNPELVERMARAEFELERARLIAALSNERLIEQYRAAGIEIADIVEMLADLEWTAPTVGQRPPGQVRYPGGRPPAQQRPGLDTPVENELDRLREQIAGMIESWLDRAGPVRSAIEDINEQLAEVTEKWLAAGGVAADLADLQEAALAKQGMILEEHFKQVDDRLAAFDRADPRKTVFEQFESGMADLIEVSEAVRAGDVDRLNEALGIWDQLQSLVTGSFDVTGGLGARLFDQLRAMLEQLRFEGIDLPEFDGSFGDGAGIPGIPDTVDDGTGSVATQTVELLTDIRDFGIRTVRQLTFANRSLSDISGSFAGFGSVEPHLVAIDAKLERSNRIAAASRNLHSTAETHRRSSLGALLRIATSVVQSNTTA